MPTTYVLIYKNILHNPKKSFIDLILFAILPPHQRRRSLHVRLKQKHNVVSQPSFKLWHAKVDWAGPNKWPPMRSYDVKLSNGWILHCSPLSQPVRTSMWPMQCWRYWLEFLGAFYKYLNDFYFRNWTITWQVVRIWLITPLRWPISLYFMRLPTLFSRWQTRKRMRSLIFRAGSIICNKIRTFDRRLLW